MAEPHVHSFGPPKLARDGAGGAFRQCDCGFHESVSWADGFEKGRVATLAELRARGVVVHADAETGAAPLPTVGDFVRVAGYVGSRASAALVGRYGKVVDVVDVGVSSAGISLAPFIAVEFAEPFPRGHDCGGYARNHHGWLFRSDELEVVE